MAIQQSYLIGELILIPYEVALNQPLRINLLGSTGRLIYQQSSPTAQFA
ncbi:MAG: hypothetical protein RMY34_00450 [Aulosira sp. DedQUE10]|nr:hypothetical protein [Aulosira sp. DedQUE10]